MRLVIVIVLGLAGAIATATVTADAAPVAEPATVVDAAEDHEPDAVVGEPGAVLAPPLTSQVASAPSGHAVHPVTMSPAVPPPRA